MSPTVRPRVLCVDDDEDSRLMLCELLKLLPIEVRAVGTAAQALSLIETEHFDLYTLDAWLPEVDGFELCRRIRAIDRNTPVLFFSGAAYEADKERGIEAGANAYLVKPDVIGVLEEIRRLVPCREGPAVRTRREESYSAPSTLQNAQAAHAS